MIDRKFVPYLIVALLLISLLVFYTAYDKKSKGIVLQKMLKVLSFEDAKNSLRELNKIAALASVGLISAAFLIGPFSRILPNVFVPLLYMRKPLGLCGFALAFAHSAYSAVEYYGLDVGQMLNSPKAVGIEAGVVALVIFFLMSITSTAGALKRMGYARWKALQTCGYAGLALTLAHFLILETKPDLGFDVRPYGLLFFFVGVLALLLRLIVVFVRTRQKSRHEHHFGKER